MSDFARLMEMAMGTDPEKPGQGPHADQVRQALGEPPPEKDAKDKPAASGERTATASASVSSTTAPKR